MTCYDYWSPIFYYCSIGSLVLYYYDILHQQFFCLWQDMLSLSLPLIECKKQKKGDMVWYGDLVMDFVIFQGTRFFYASVQKNCSGVGDEYEFSMA